MDDTAIALIAIANAALIGWVAWLLNARASTRIEAQAVLETETTASARPGTRHSCVRR